MNQAASDHSDDSDDSDLLEEAFKNSRFRDARNRIAAPISMSEIKHIARTFSGSESDGVAVDDVYGIDRAHIAIRLRATDAEILEAVQSLITKYRKAAGITPVVYGGGSGFNLARIRQNKILAFVDLSLWAEIHGHTISNPLYIRVLFPMAPKREDYVRTTLRPLAEAALEPSFFFAACQTETV